MRRCAAALLVLAVGCGGSDSPDPSDSIAEPGSTDDGVARTVDVDSTEAPPATDPPSVLDDPGLNPEGVINAAVLLHSDGDLDAALADGAFSRADLDAARAGLADGSLDYLFE